MRYAFTLALGLLLQISQALALVAIDENTPPEIRADIYLRTTEVRAVHLFDRRDPYPLIQFGNPNWEAAIAATETLIELYDEHPEKVDLSYLAQAKINLKEQIKTIQTGRHPVFGWGLPDLVKHKLSRPVFNKRYIPGKKHDSIQELSKTEAKDYWKKAIEELEESVARLDLILETEPSDKLTSY